MFLYSETQQRRLKELGVRSEECALSFSTREEREKQFQITERSLVKAERKRLQHFCQDVRRSRVSKLERDLSDVLVNEGFVEVRSPLLISGSSLAKMGIDQEHPLHSQVFWVDGKKCLRPMLAPNLYSVARDLLRITDGVVRIFEIGSCFRKESQGARHANEFTMCNIAEFGLPEAQRHARLEELAKLVLTAAKTTDYTFEVETSEVYGDTIDVVHKPTDLELASGAMGPHPLDSKWRVNSTWVGVGFGLERLVMIGDKECSMGSLGRSLGYMDGIRLTI
ncbi:hypothetical protein JWJ90_16655 [Desulfobulbus rhabdoformis]|uniref:pyrrolysine--tRNA(Pyl) ligase large subunit n=1 Tax=Desulfobulbus rhabdoformis TaxID=34032 RepID=UPI0019644EC7|nr:pyrrolysine--tRNA(Pyl) ligase large subunit [Desulfobulbus rhabdoformis]MBM9615902.1 hypothetical protein [Desulfobulbus rhabdoformis]